MRPGISVVINTFNEEKHLPYALRSVRSWADEIIVVDMHSEDRTVEIARQFGAKVFFHERLGFADPARAFALQQATAEWIFVLDADEVVPLPLSRELLRIAASNDVDAVFIHRLNYFFGSPLLHMNCGPHEDKQLRFWRKDHVQATPTIHKFFHVVSGSRSRDLAYEPGLALEHFTYLDCEDFIARLNRYTNIEARQSLERGERLTAFRAVAEAFRQFIVRYIKQRGFQDGWRGFYVTLFYMFYGIVSAAKLRELTTVGTREQIEARYQLAAEELLKGYSQSGTQDCSSGSVEVSSIHGG